MHPRTAMHPGSAAVVLVLKRLADARRDGDSVVAVLDETGSEAPDLVIGSDSEADLDRTADAATPGFDPADLYGVPHAATGLLSVAVGALALHHRARPRAGAPAVPSSARTVEVCCPVREGTPARTRLRADAAQPWLDGAAPRVRVYSGRDRADVIAALDAERESVEGPARLALVTAEDLADRRAHARRWLLGKEIQPRGAAYRDAPLAGETAFVFTNGSAAYPDMGRELALAFPELLDRTESSAGADRSLLAGTGGDALDQIAATGLMIGLHTGISRSLLGNPDAVIGYSSGETAAMAALGMWADPGHVARCRESGLFDREIGGEYRAVRRSWARDGIEGTRWASYLVALDATEVRAALADEPAVHLMAVNAPGLCVVGGEADACASWVARQPVQAVPIAYDLAAHAPEVAEFREQWWQLHHLPTTPIPGIRVYSCASGESYEPTAERVADALTGQMLGTIDYVRVIERAWADGVRVFVEHGPRNLCTSWIGRILGDREHLAVALDGPERGGLDQLAQVVAELTAAGVAIEPGAVLGHRADTGSVPDRRERLSIPITTEVSLPARVDRQPTEVMAHAPRLPAAPTWTPPTPVAAAPTPAFATPANAVAIAEHRDRITAVHRTMLAARAEAHRTFADTQNEAQRRYLETMATVLTSLPREAFSYPTDRPENPFHPATPVHVETPVRPAILDQPGPAYPGPSFDREQLEFLAHERISTLFGPAFVGQDHRRRQTRLPRPPMLLVDRVLGIDAVPAALASGSATTTEPPNATGTIWTETDVPLDAWYLDATGRMPAGIMVEAGQSDLLLISWLGADLVSGTNDEDRVYRLLGCDLTLHGSPALPGDTLRYEINIDGHAEHNGVRLFFFHYDCYVGDELRMTVRNGQAGYFTDAELNESQGVLWDPTTVVPDPDVTVDPPPLAAASRFAAEQVRAFTEGRPADCFGPDWELTRAHIRSPRAGSDRLRMLHDVPAFDPTGGPWGRGYLRAETPVAADDWFFDGHFHNDPCMPGTLMLEGALQAMAFYLAACGHTIDRDGWRFEPAPGAAATLRCRRQVTPADSRVVYEVFVTGHRGGDEPALTADVVCSVDGVQAFHAQGLELRLVPDWPLEHWRHLGPARVQRDGTPVPPAALGGLSGYRDENECVTVGGVRADYPMLLATAWGRQSAAFAPWVEGPGESRRIPRLPGPPYHFMTRVVEENIARGAERVGDRVVTEYDVPDSAWYFEQNGHPTMPLAVLMEVALQPCGCLANQVTDLGSSSESLYFRNLDGKGEVVGEVTPATRVVRTEVTLRGVARHGGMIIETFEVECWADSAPLLTFSTVFGYFPKAALREQVGLPPSTEERAALGAPAERAVELTDYATSTRPGMPGPMLLMLDRVTGYWPEGGKAGLGRLRAEKDIDADDWYFKAHFFQDPVQPGSLGVEAVCQLLQFYLLASGRTAGLREPRFEPVKLGAELNWKYRGQILPTDGIMTVELEITEVASDNRGAHATGEAWLWVDDRRIYHVPTIGVRAVAGARSASISSAESVLDSAEQDWLLDHRVGWLTPTMPLMSMVDHLARAAAVRTDRPVAGLSEVRLSRWLPVDRPVRLRTEVEAGAEGATDQAVVSLSAWREAATDAMSRFEQTAAGTVRLGEPRGGRPAPFPPLTDALDVPDPYTSAGMFHGPAFQYVTSLRLSPLGSTTQLDVGNGRVPRGQLHQGLLDAALHGVPCVEMWRWIPEVDADAFAVPHRVSEVDFYEPLPDSGPVVAEARFAGFADDNPLLPSVDIQLQVAGRVAVAMRVVFLLMRSPLLGNFTPRQRRAYLRDRQYVEAAGLSTAGDGTTELHVGAVDAANVVPNATAHIYGISPDTPAPEQAPVIAVKEHLSRLFEVHPYVVEVADDLGSAWVAGRPETIRAVRVREGEGLVTVTNVPAQPADTAPSRSSRESSGQ